MSRSNRTDRAQAASTLFRTTWTGAAPVTLHEWSVSSAVPSRNGDRKLRAQAGILRYRSILGGVDGAFGLPLRIGGNTKPHSSPSARAASRISSTRVPSAQCNPGFRRSAPGRASHGVGRRSTKSKTRPGGTFRNWAASAVCRKRPPRCRNPECSDEFFSDSFGGRQGSFLGLVGRPGGSGQGRVRRAGHLSHAPRGPVRESGACGDLSPAEPGPQPSDRREPNSLIFRISSRLGVRAIRENTGPYCRNNVALYTRARMQAPSAASGTHLEAFV